MDDLVLIIEDEEEIVKLLEYNLQEADFKVLSALDGPVGLQLARDHKPDLVILDLMLPGMDGKDVCKQLKREKDTEHIPIIMLTAKTSELDRVVGLELGADDYVTKPFSPRELVLRCKNILRRMRTTQETEDRFEVEDLVIDVPGYRVYMKDEILDLTPTEFKLLLQLVRNRGKVQTRSKLLNQVWDVKSLDVDTRTIDTHMRRLRQKLGDMADYVETVRGVGYMFRAYPSYN
jgi:two-component system phosphate regulon response regulator PhoB